MFPVSFLNRSASVETSPFTWFWIESVVMVSACGSYQRKRQWTPAIVTNFYEQGTIFGGFVLLTKECGMGCARLVMWNYISIKLKPGSDLNSSFFSFLKEYLSRCLIYSIPLHSSNTLTGSRPTEIPYPTKNPLTWLFFFVSCPNYTYEVCQFYKLTSFVSKQ